MTQDTDAGINTYELPIDLLEQLRERAPGFDERNEFCAPDIEDLKRIGYFTCFLPREFGGAGLSLPQVCELQTTLARYAPATALCVNMHQIIIGLGHTLARSSEDGNQAAGRRIFQLAAQGAIFGFGISEPGNDLVLFNSISKALPVDDGSYLFSGTKIFTSLGSAWTHLVTFGRDDSVEGAPLSVFAIIDRKAGGVKTVEDWDALGMRATGSHTTVLHEAPALSENILGKVAPGASIEPIILGIFANFEILLAATYAGIGLRALEVGASRVKERRSVKRGEPYSTDPDIRWRLASGAIRMDAVGAHLREISGAFWNGEDRGMRWLPMLSNVKHQAVEASKLAVEESIRACGGHSYYSGVELSRLYRDVLAGLFQPSDAESLHGAWANMLLGPA
ncbi:MAG: acyl-CoA dehydrogenase family protein [Actinomycetaceae bacterium]|nr:acyl-CoA dehydrogenase family protein [Actinomycetaceae bacterium]